MSDHRSYHTLKIHNTNKPVVCCVSSDLSLSSTTNINTSVWELLINLSIKLIFKGSTISHWAVRLSSSITGLTSHDINQMHKKQQYGFENLFVSGWGFFLHFIFHLSLPSFIFCHLPIIHLISSQNWIIFLHHVSKPCKLSFLKVSNQKMMENQRVIEQKMCKKFDYGPLCRCLHHSIKNSSV